MSYQRVKIDQYGDPLSVLQLETVPAIPTPSNDEIVIKLIASAIHPSDLAFVAGQYVAYGATKPVPPTYPGSEGVGRIHALGQDVAEFSIGQRISFYSEKHAWSEYLVIKRPFSSVIPVPDILPDTVAGQVFINPLTTYGMIAEINAKPDEWILQTAAGSVLSQMTIQLAKIRGLQLINVVRRAAQVEELKSRYGNDIHVLAFDGSNEAQAIQQIKDITKGKGVNYVLDPVGGPTAEFALKVLAMNGRALFYGLISGLPDIKVSYANLLMQNQRIEGFRVAAWISKHSPEQLGKIFGDLIGLLASKQVLPVLEDVLPFGDFNTAIAKSVAPGKLGKVFLAPHPEQVSEKMCDSSVSAFVRD